MDTNDEIDYNETGDDWVDVNTAVPRPNQLCWVYTESGQVMYDCHYDPYCGWEWLYEAGADYWIEISDPVLFWKLFVTPAPPKSDQIRVDSEEA